MIRPPLLVAERATRARRWLVPTVTYPRLRRARLGLSYLCKARHDSVCALAEARIERQLLHVRGLAPAPTPGRTVQQRRH